MMNYVVLCVTFLVIFPSAGAQNTRPGVTNSNTGTFRGAGGAARGAAGGAAGAAAARPTCNPKNCVCHGEFGCFRKRMHCLENTAPLPQSPASIGTSFLIYKRGTRGIRTLSLTMPSTAVYAAGFDSRQPTIIAIHGWTQSASAFNGLKNMLLKKGDYNVILVNWEKGAGLTGRWPQAYTQPVQNTRVVGKHVAMLISHLQTTTGIVPGSVHLIGASLGAQVAGYAGMYLNGTVGRISGLDPAKPNFEGQPTDCKLDASDAQLVDIIHTNMDVAGVAESVGHVDFFPNGGRNQPGCSNPICSHLRAKSYFRASVWTDCKFKTRRCDGKPCGPQGCPAMGFNAFRPRDHSQGGDFCLNTTERPPYCIDIKEKPQPGRPAEPRPKPPSRGRPQSPRSGNNPNVGTGSDRTSWFNHGKPMQPGGVKPGWSNGAGNGPGVQSPRAAAHGPASNTQNSLQKVVLDAQNSGIRHQTTFYTTLTLILTAVVVRLL